MLTFQYNIDYASFNSVYKVDTPTESAKQLIQDAKKKKKKKASKNVADESGNDVRDNGDSKNDVNKNVKKKVDNNDIRNEICKTFCPCRWLHELKTLALISEARFSKFFRTKSLI